MGGTPYGSTVVPFKLELGQIDIVELYAREGLVQGHITKAVAWYTYEEDRVMGQNGLREFFVNNPPAFEKLKAQVNAA